MLAPMRSNIITAITEKTVPRISYESRTESSKHRKKCSGELDSALLSSGRCKGSGDMEVGQPPREIFAEQIYHKAIKYISIKTLRQDP